MHGEKTKDILIAVRDKLDATIKKHPNSASNLKPRRNRIDYAIKYDKFDLMQKDDLDIDNL